MNLRRLLLASVLGGVAGGAAWASCGDQLPAQARQLAFQVDRAIYDAAAPIVVHLIAREVARYVFGAAGEARRSIADDEVIQAAERLIAGAKSQDEVIARAATAKPKD